MRRLHRDVDPYRPTLNECARVRCARLALLRVNPSAASARKGIFYVDVSGTWVGRPYPFFYMTLFFQP